MYTVGNLQPENVLPICLYMFTTTNNNKHKRIGTLDTIHVKTRNNTVTELWHITEMSSMVTEDFLLHRCAQ